MNGQPETGCHAADNIVFHFNAGSIIAPQMQAGSVFNNCFPLNAELNAVVLRAWAPHGRTFRTVEHAELNHGFVSHNAREATDCIYFPDYLTFSNTANGRIARHARKSGQVLRNQQYLRAQIGSRSGSFASGMTSADDNYIVILKNFHCST
ncbi:hypothetical protein DSECCO2_510840 [anaerobic digester metagenome]